ncbi:hypothetical protein [Paraclostridium sordellii]|uniref:hypothetical protein n=1 Tax=Paraclostridium sordellii TaxID=1505 RepID=UPI000E4BC040|nr:hypothetical protein [Paeniclostridium sordellii]RGX03147.1 hypothetical protein DWV40_14680 [Paeniclostridium sordellii]
MEDFQIIDDLELSMTNGGGSLLGDLAWVGGYFIGGSSKATERMIKVRKGVLPMNVTRCYQ